VSQQVDHSKKEYVLAAIENSKDALVTVTSACESGDSIVVGGGFAVRVGVVCYIRGEGYMASGPIVSIEREDAA
jgi:hypothetical protein